MIRKIRTIRKIGKIRKIENSENTTKSLYDKTKHIRTTNRKMLNAPSTRTTRL